MSPPRSTPLDPLEDVDPLAQYDSEAASLPVGLSLTPEKRLLIIRDRIQLRAALKQNMLLERIGDALFDLAEEVEKLRARLVP